ncbi:hypothetical protein ACFWMG_44715, partial [Streptomyces sp. NPDC127074]
GGGPRWSYSGGSREPPPGSAAGPTPTPTPGGPTRPTAWSDWAGAPRRPSGLAAERAERAWAAEAAERVWVVAMAEVSGLGWSPGWAERA